ncbi:MBL fold metallo-hydrolase [Enterococcus casseliflavus]|uniref:MBL fold metallo-hydrolase n=1 Tax=Enterococcus casseliflavus TaxID=37734 RepID=UPI0012E1EE74|nr:MBL fold metallo-hydrolase [Enterococcus casseliflavus]MUN72880.1 MBL fold metallo-hydrolase [Enterococcus casseliflavus]MUN95835.1 MBL fold metallo-hydrolase [Enterococcus casseliflavus]
MTNAKQAIPPKTIVFNEKAFQKTDQTIIRWLGNSGILLNSRGTCIMVDPVLEGFDLPLLIDLPIKPSAVPHLDAVLITHSDNDHYSIPTIDKFVSVTDSFHGPKYVAELIKEHFHVAAQGHDIYDSFTVKNLTISLTKAYHLWQNETTKFDRVFQIEDYCGFWIDTPDGSLWIPGDSRLLPEQLEMPQPDAILFDFNDNAWHIGFENAVKLANTYPHAELILSHWGTVDAPHIDAFNGDPEALYDRIVNPKRIRLVAAGEPIELKSPTPNNVR